MGAKLEALQSLMSRLDLSKEVREMEGRVIVIEATLKEINRDFVEARADIKALLSFRSLLLGLGSAISLVISALVSIISRIVWR